MIGDKFLYTDLETQRQAFRGCLNGASAARAVRWYGRLPPHPRGRSASVGWGLASDGIECQSGSSIQPLTKEAPP